MHRWYRDVLSDYAKDGGASVHRHDLKIQNGKKETVIEVPILRTENFGSKMAIDEKHIGEDFYTVVSNRDTGRIAVLCKSVVFGEIKHVIQKCKTQAEGVTSITRDFSSLFEKVCTELFPSAIQTGDKFHVIHHLMEAHQAVRIRYRQKELDKQRKVYQEFKKSELLRLAESERTGERFKPEKFHYQEERLANGETPLEILARSRYLLFKYHDRWTRSQQKRATTLFSCYPEIQQAYTLSCQFRDWLSKKNIGKQYLEIDKQLHKWYEDIETTNIEELLNFKHLVETHENIICNYFLKGETNAIAEAINNKIQKFISSNQGTRDRDFFFFRLANYYA